MEHSGSSGDRNADVLELLVAATLTWTNPTMNAHQPVDSLDSYRCEGELPLTDLARVEIRAQERWVSHDTLLAVIDVHGREGMTETYTTDVVGQWTAWVVAVDDSGNASCSSAAVGINVPPASVPPRPDDHVQWYDIAGRRVDPHGSGVYFLKENGRVRAVVRLR